MSENIQLLIPFLKQLTNDIENNELTPYQLREVSEFYMSYQFYNRPNNIVATTTPSPDITEEDITKFVILGWYCYCVLLEDHRFSIKKENENKE